MTPAQKLIDAAAEQQYEADRAIRAKGGWVWPEWAAAVSSEKDRYRRRVTIPVTVAMKAAVEVANAEVDESIPVDDFDRAWDAACVRIAKNISSLIP